MAPPTVLSIDIDQHTVACPPRAGENGAGAAFARFGTKSGSLAVSWTPIDAVRLLRSLRAVDIAIGDGEQDFLGISVAGMDCAAHIDSNHARHVVDPEKAVRYFRPWPPRAPRGDAGSRPYRPGSRIRRHPTAPPRPGHAPATECALRPGATRRRRSCDRARRLESPLGIRKPLAFRRQICIS